MKKNVERFGNDKENNTFLIINYTFLVISFMLILYPLIYIVSSSLSSSRAVMSGKVWLFPVEFSLAGYQAVFQNKYILSGYTNTIFYTLTGTLLNVIITLAAAYPLSRKDFAARNVIMLAFAFTMFFSGGMIPDYLLVSNLGLINTRWAIILPGALSVYNVILVRTYFQSTISTELREAAQLDGCSDIKFIMKIVIPLSGAIIAVITLFYAVGHWNAFFKAFIYLNDKKLFPLQLILREILIMNDIDASMLDIKDMEAKIGMAELLKYSLIIVASLPVLCIYPFIQRFFVKGVMIGSIKG